MPDRLRLALALSALLTLGGGCASVAAPAPGSAGPTPNAAELRYAAETGRAIYRRLPVEQTRGFVFAGDGRGYGLCVRAVRNGRLDHTLLVLQRRIEGAVSQVEDDATILRSGAEVAPCRDRTDWAPVR
ncbi:hypothetical protein [Aureimonas sp. AU4]|uniref:hypothetical protein n=1 Tax=Aureimonas sp. AU4 TaxID=1638163 RepID=UPI0007823C2B|nr:hypothetical protein [Aureimonas sp. AU4]